MAVEDTAVVVEIQLLATATLLLRVDVTMHTQRLQEDTAIAAHTDLI